MQEDQPKEEIKIKNEKCDDPGCENCGDWPDYIEGTVQHVLEYVHNKSMDRDDILLDMVLEQTAFIAMLLQRIEALERPLMRLDGGSLN